MVRPFQEIRSFDGARSEIPAALLREIRIFSLVGSSHGEFHGYFYPFAAYFAMLIFLAKLFYYSPKSLYFGLQKVAKCRKCLQMVAKGCKGLQMVANGCKGLRNLEKGFAKSR